MQTCARSSKSIYWEGSGQWTSTQQADDMCLKGKEVERDRDREGANELEPLFPQYSLGRTVYQPIITLVPVMPDHPTPTTVIIIISNSFSDV